QHPSEIPASGHSPVRWQGAGARPGATVQVPIPASGGSPCMGIMIYGWSAKGLTVRIHGGLLNDISLLNDSRPAGASAAAVLNPRHRVVPQPLGWFSGGPRQPALAGLGHPTHKNTKTHHGVGGPSREELFFGRGPPPPKAPPHPKVA